MQISCIVPAWNEEKTIEHVIDVLLKVKGISELIVINDGSVDKTAELISKYSTSCIVINNDANIGKSATIAMGINCAKGDTIMMIDADLSGLTVAHVNMLIDAYKANKEAMVIAAATEYGDIIDTAFAPFSGQRIFPKNRVGDLSSIAELSYAIEVFLNSQFKKEEQVFIAFEGAGHINKSDKTNPIAALPQYISAYTQILIGMVVIAFVKLQDGLKLFLRL